MPKPKFLSISGEHYTTLEERDRANAEYVEKSTSLQITLERIRLTLAEKLRQDGFIRGYEVSRENLGQNIATLVPTPDLTLKLFRGKFYLESKIIDKAMIDQNSQPGERFVVYLKREEK